VLIILSIKKYRIIRTLRVLNILGATILIPFFPFHQPWCVVESVAIKHLTCNRRQKTWSTSRYTVLHKVSLKLKKGQRKGNKTKIFSIFNLCCDVKANQPTNTDFNSFNKETRKREKERRNGRTVSCSCNSCTCCSIAVKMI